MNAAASIGIYGGYDPANWSRKATLITSIVGVSEGIRAEDTTGVVLQLLRARGATNAVNPPAGMSFYGLRAINSSRLTLQRVTLTARGGEPGADGARGANGAAGSNGAEGGKGQCGGDKPGAGGAGGDGVAGRNGGTGGKGGKDTGGSAGTGRNGAPGSLETPGGLGKPAGDPGR